METRAIARRGTHTNRTCFEKKLYRMGGGKSPNPEPSDTYQLGRSNFNRKLLMYPFVCTAEDKLMSLCDPHSLFIEVTLAMQFFCPHAKKEHFHRAILT